MQSLLKNKTRTESCPGKNDTRQIQYFKLLNFYMNNL
jgi:hypothetical protein